MKAGRRYSEEQWAKGREALAVWRLDRLPIFCVRSDRFDFAQFVEVDDLGFRECLAKVRAARANMHQLLDPPERFQ